MENKAVELNTLSGHYDDRDRLTEGKENNGDCSDSASCCAFEARHKKPSWAPGGQAANTPPLSAPRGPRP